MMKKALVDWKREQKSILWLINQFSLFWCTDKILYSVFTCIFHLLSVKSLQYSPFLNFAKKESNFNKFLYNQSKTLFSYVIHIGINMGSIHFRCSFFSLCRLYISFNLFRFFFRQLVYLLKIRFYNGQKKKVLLRQTCMLWCVFLSLSLFFCFYIIL